MKVAHEAMLTKGSRVHAVVMEALPPYAERQDLVYTTVCKQLVRGSSIYRSEFNRPGTDYIPCDNCRKRVAEALGRMPLEGRMERVLTQLERGAAQGFSAQEPVTMTEDRGREMATSYVMIRGTRYEITLQEVE